MRSHDNFGDMLGFMGFASLFFVVSLFAVHWMWPETFPLVADDRVGPRETVIRKNDLGTELWNRKGDFNGPTL